MAGKTRVTCFGCQTRRTAEWCALDDAELALLDRVKQPREREAGTTLFDQGAPCAGLYCIQTGLVGIRKLDARGNSTLLRLCGAGETVGYRAFLRKSDHLTTAEMLLPGRVCFIDRATVRALLTQNPNLGLRFLDHSVRDADELAQRYFEGVTFPVRTRLLNVLMVLYERFGGLDADGRAVLELPLSRQDLAALIGTSPESMSRNIGRVQDEGFARFEGRTVRIDDIDALMRHLPAS